MHFKKNQMLLNTVWKNYSLLVLPYSRPLESVHWSLTLIFFSMLHVKFSRYQLLLGRNHSNWQPKQLYWQSWTLMIRHWTEQWEHHQTKSTIASFVRGENAISWIVNWWYSSLVHADFLFPQSLSKANKQSGFVPRF